MKSLVVSMTLVFVVLFGVNCALAQVVFEENFDGQPDWWPTARQSSCIPSSCISGVPSNWTYWRNDELWTPFGVSPTLGSNPSIQITPFNHYGATGKAFTVWNESNNGASGDGWGADGILAKRLDQDYKEIFVQIKIKFQPDFKFWKAGQAQSLIKLFRIYHYDGTGSPFTFFTNGFSAPIYIMDVQRDEYGTKSAHAIRIDPQETQYSSYLWPYQRFVGSPQFESSIGDGNWHTLSWQAKINSALDATDGVIKFWMDGVLQAEKTDIPFLKTGSNMSIGWNVVAIGGNSLNLFSDVANKAEQWYAIDDVVVSTTPIPVGYVIGGAKPPASSLQVPNPTCAAILAAEERRSSNRSANWP